MIVRAIDTNGDWTYGKGIEDYRKDRLAVAQDIGTRLRSFFGDCFFAVNDGIDWFNLLGSKNQIGLNLAVSATILGTQGVTSLLQLSTSLNANRNLTIVYSVNTAFGVVTTTETFTPPDFLTTQDGQVLITEDGNPLIIG